MRIPVLMSMVFCAAILSAQTPTGSSQEKPKESETIHQLFMDDQEQIPGAANGISRLSPEEYEKLLKVRQAKVHAMIAAAQSAKFAVQAGNGTVNRGNSPPNRFWDLGLGPSGISNYSREQRKIREPRS